MPHLVARAGVLQRWQQFQVWLQHAVQLLSVHPLMTQQPGHVQHPLKHSKQGAGAQHSGWRVRGRWWRGGVVRDDHSQGVDGRWGRRLVAPAAAHASPEVAARSRA